MSSKQWRLLMECQKYSDSLWVGLQSPVFFSQDVSGNGSYLRQELNAIIRGEDKEKETWEG